MQKKCIFRGKMWNFIEFTDRNVGNFYENTYKMIVWYINHTEKCVSWSKMVYVQSEVIKFYWSS